MTNNTNSNIQFGVSILIKTYAPFFRWLFLKWTKWSVQLRTHFSISSVFRFWLFLFKELLSFQLFQAVKLIFIDIHYFIFQSYCYFQDYTILNDINCITKEKRYLYELFNCKDILSIYFSNVSRSLMNIAKKI